MRWLWSLVLLAACTAAAAAPLELDLSPSASLKGVLVLPPVTAVVVEKKGFVGLDTRRTVERLVLPAHGKLVKAIDAKLGGKVLTADLAQGVINKQGVPPSSLDKPEVVARLAKVTGVNWVVAFNLNNRALTATLFDAAGKKAADDFVVSGVSNLTDAQAATLAGQLVPRLLELEKARVAAEAALKPPVVEAAPLPPPEDDIHDAELEQLISKTPDTTRPIDRNRVRALVAVGPGATLRGLSLSGETADALAQLENGVVVGLGVTAQLMPLELFEATSGKAWSQVSIEVNYRRAFVSARGVGGGLEGESCTMTDDDLQLRLGARYRLGEGYLPTIGLAGGWSQEQTHFACNLPLVSTTWRGIDAQLRVRQPLFRDVITLELIGGPRFLMPGPLAQSPGFSLSAEAWVEVKPISVLFGRMGVRYSRLQAANPALSVIDSRTFVALELGAFL